MARKRSKAPVARRGSNRTAEKLRARISAAARRRSQEKKQTLQDMSAVAGGAALGAIDRWGPKNFPLDIPGIPDDALYSLAAYLIGDRVMTGKAGEVVRGLGVGGMACAARDLVAQGFGDSD